MILCFGTFASVLNCCKQGLPQERFIPRVVWVVDRKNRCLGSKSREDRYDSEQEEIPDDFLDNMEGNKTVVSKLLSCRQQLKFRDTHLPSVDIASERFKAKVMPYINEDKIVKAVLAVLYIISKDETIWGERKETFKKYVGMYKGELLGHAKFDVPDFFTKVLLYTTSVNNRKGKLYAKEITEDFIERAATTIDGSARSKWDATTQTVEISTETQLWSRSIPQNLPEASYSTDYIAQLMRSRYKRDRSSSS